MSSSRSVVVVGMGELGAEFARGLLRSGRTVTPVLRTDSPSALAKDLPDPELALVTVGEADLHPVLESLPVAWRSRVGLVQNELLPRDWRAHGIDRPTVAVVWFEKKPGQVAKVLLPTVLAGPGAPLLASALDAIGIAQRIVDVDSIELELVAKNLYILLVNLAGLKTRGTVDALWNEHRAFAESVAKEVLDLQEALGGKPVPRAELFARFEEAVRADPDHGTTGRTAPARLARALRHAEQLGVAVPVLRSIAEDAAS